MTKHCDLHLHLGGSIQKDLLIDFAQADRNQEALDSIKKADVLQLFKIIHQLINSPERIKIATENVTTNNSADYLEVRTTPRRFPFTASFRPYVEAFVSGLRRYPDKVKGLLSIDRYKHDLKVAREILALALEYPDCIVGVDISGVNPKGKRLLQGSNLSLIIKEILDSPLGLALHIGELDSDKDQRDSTAALTTIDQWFEQNPQTISAGKIRLGHAIFLDNDHKNIIRKHQLPIEICPTCHRFVGYWGKGQKHPVQDIYLEKDAPVVLGTDNTLNFTTSFQREVKLFTDELPYDLGEAWDYRFRRSEMPPK